MTWTAWLETGLEEKLSSKTLVEQSRFAPKRIPYLTFITTATAEDSGLASGTLDAVELSEFQVHGRHLKDGDRTHTLTRF